MLRLWSLRNFKSYKHLDNLRLSNINVIAGANSSGKSTIIQSILLLKQSLQYGSPDRPVALNGPLLRMGAFQDLRNNEATGEAVSYNFEFDVAEERAGRTDASPWFRELKLSNYPKGKSEIQTINVKFSLTEEDQQFGVFQTALPSTTTLLMPDLSVSASSQDGDDPIKKSEIILNRRPPSADGKENQSPFEYDVELDLATEEMLLEDLPDAEIIGAFTRSFLPSIIGIEYDRGAKDADNFVRDLFTPRAVLSSRPTDFLASELPQEALDLIRDWYHEVGESELPLTNEEPSDVELVERLQFLIRRNSPSRQRTLLGEGQTQHSNPAVWFAEHISTLRAEVTDILRNKMGGQRTVIGKKARDIERSSDFLTAFFQEGVRYLGPLRDGPRPVYQPEALESETDVGYKGEHTAAVLDANRFHRVEYRRPPNETLDEDYALYSESAAAPLNRAVNEWLVYLGVAEDVVTTDAGVYGNRLQVSTDKYGQLHDLINVGVGVSQVLPIVVMALLAPKGSLLIFEQPELHLHPKVQARLADLFLALALDGKQMILETHSEYLIDRFRLRVALSETDSVRPLVNMLFSEKSSGQTNLRSVELNEYGGVLDWPSDFFEQSQKDVSRILRATAKRRKAAKTK